MMNQGWRYCDRISPAAAGQTVLAFYSQRYRHSSQDDWQARIEAGQIQLNGAPVAPDTILQIGQTLTYDRLPWFEPPVPLQFDVLFDDGDLLIIHKPAGLPVLPGGNFLSHTLLHQLKLQYGPKNPPLPVHRLGRGTSGLMVLARSTLARSTLSRQLRDSTASLGQRHTSQSICKTYRALLGPSDLPDHFTITTPIGKLAHPRLGYVYGADPGGLPAYSQGQVLRRSPQSTLVAVTIRTGRPHQIRIHMAAAGYPLLGDPLYGVGGIPRSPDCMTDPEAMPVPGDTGYLLHAYRLEFIHPHTQQPLTLVCPMPPWPGCN